ncbi:MAG: hypothetical protein ACRDD7_08665 [Peptostreptococcaceae bacterium]
MFVVGINDNYTMSVPNQILPLIAGDYDYVNSRIIERSVMKNSLNCWERLKLIILQRKYEIQLSVNVIER